MCCTETIAQWDFARVSVQPLCDHELHLTR